MGPSKFIDPQVAEKPLTEEEHQLRVEFVRLFMKNRDAYQACIELGFMSSYAFDWAIALMKEGVVRRLISEAERYEESEEASLENRRKYRAWMERDATDRSDGSSHSARVAAIAHLMRIEGMDPSTKTQTELTYKGGVMIVPALTSPDEWGKLSAQSQAELKQNVKD